MLSEQLMQVESTIIKMPNFLARSERKSLFKEKYPSVPKIVTVPKKAKKIKLISEAKSSSPFLTKRARKLPKR